MKWPIVNRYSVALFTPLELCASDMIHVTFLNCISPVSVKRPLFLLVSYGARFVFRQTVAVILFPILAF